MNEELVNCHSNHIFVRDGVMIRTQRLNLSPWHEGHRLEFARLHADSEVMADLGGPIEKSASDAKLDRYIVAYREHGISRWAVESADGAFLGYAGVMPRLSSDHPLGPHYEIGWRFFRSAWGFGYATESASAALKHAFSQCGLTEVLSYTSAANLRSQAVMMRLELRRDPSRDFSQHYPMIGLWQGLVWTTKVISDGKRL